MSEKTELQAARAAADVLLSFAERHGRVSAVLAQAIQVMAEGGPLAAALALVEGERDAVGVPAMAAIDSLAGAPGPGRASPDMALVLCSRAGGDWSADHILRRVSRVNGRVGVQQMTLTHDDWNTLTNQWKKPPIPPVAACKSTVDDFRQNLARKVEDVERAKAVGEVIQAEIDARRATGKSATQKQQAELARVPRQVAEAETAAKRARESLESAEETLAKSRLLRDAGLGE